MATHAGKDLAPQICGQTAEHTTATQLQSTEGHAGQRRMPRHYLKAVVFCIMNG